MTAEVTPVISAKFVAGVYDPWWNEQKLDGGWSFNHPRLFSILFTNIG